MLTILYRDKVYRNNNHSRHADDEEKNLKTIRKIRNFQNLRRNLRLATDQWF